MYQMVRSLYRATKLCGPDG